MDVAIIGACNAFKQFGASIRHLSTILTKLEVNVVPYGQTFRMSLTDWTDNYHYYNLDYILEELDELFENFRAMIRASQFIGRTSEKRSPALGAILRAILKIPAKKKGPRERPWYSANKDFG